MKKETVVLIILLLSLALYIPNIKAAQISITPLADSYVDSSDTDVNKGGSNTLYTYNYEYELLGTLYTYYHNAWLKFDLSKIPSEATVNSIILRMHTSIIGTSTTNQVGVFICDDNSWTELGITWNNAPSPSSIQPLRTVNVATSDRDYDFELTSALRGKSLVSLVLETLQPTDFLGWAVFDSREGSHGPRLIAEYTMPSSPLDIGFIVIFGVAMIVVLAVIAAGVFKLRQKKETEPPAPRLSVAPPE